MQSKRQSMIETATNTGIGYVGALIIVWACIKLIPQQEMAAVASTSICTVWSLIRGYIVRRYFNQQKEKHEAS